MDEILIKIATLYRRGLISERDAWEQIVSTYKSHGFPCDLGVVKQILWHYCDKSRGGKH